MSGLPFKVIDSRNNLLGVNKHGGSIEFYPPDELYNPAPGNATIEVFDPGLQGEALERAVFGDMLHYMPMANEEFSNLRDKFADTITDEQSAIDKRAYKRSQDMFGENRPYQDWFDISRLDAYIRGYLAPDDRNEWAEVYTPEQIKILDQMKNILARPATGLLQ